MSLDKGPEDQPQGRADLHLPNFNEATNVPSLDQSFPINLKYPPDSFIPGNLSLPFPILPAQMQQYLDYDSQPLWAGNGVPNLDSFLPMPHFPGQIVIPSAGGGFGFHPAGATVNPFASDPYAYAQVPAAPFVDFGSNQFNVSSSSTTTAESKPRHQRFVLTVPSSQGRALLPLLQPPIFASLLLLLPIVPCITIVLVSWSPLHPPCRRWLHWVLRGWWLPSSTLSSVRCLPSHVPCFFSSNGSSPRIT